MLNYINKIITLFTCLLIFISCSKSPGVGGKATIKGKVIVNNVNVLADSIFYDAQDHDVFIIYGDNNNTYDDDFSTSHDGTFEFKYLNPGNYEIFLYSDFICKANNPSNPHDHPKNQDSLIKINTTIVSKKDVNDLGEIIVINDIN